MTVGQLAQRLGARWVGSSVHRETEITAVMPVESAGANDVSFVMDSKHEAAASRSGAAAILVGKPIEGLATLQLVVDDVNAALIQTLNDLAPKRKPVVQGIDDSARLGVDVQLGEGVAIGPHVVIEDLSLIHI